MKQKSSPIWNYFVVIDNSSAKCKICDNVYSRKGRTTTALKSHLKSIHVEIFAEFERLDEALKVALEAKKQEDASTWAENVRKQQLSSQQSLPIHDHLHSSHHKSQQMDRMIAEMIALQNLPLNFVEGTGFRRVMNVALPKYNLRGRDFFSSYLCDNLYSKLAKKIKDLLEDFEKLSFTTDIWSDTNSGISLLGLIAHGISKDFRKISLVLKCEVMHGRHTGLLISTKIESILQEWGINRQAVHCMFHDRGSNMVKAMQFSSFEDVNCAVHQIQLCIRAGVESQEWLQQLIGELKKIISHFNQSSAARAELTAIQKECLNQHATSAIQDCPTRWNGTFYMMEQFAKLQDSLVLYLSANPIAIITPADWTNVQKCVQIMKPFEEVTNNLSSSQASISSVIPLIHVLIITLQQEETKPDTSEKLQSFTRKLCDELNSSTRFGELIKNDKYTIATYLDPRYKSKFFNDTVKEQVESDILDLMIRRNDTNANQEDDCIPSSPKKSRKQPDDQNQASTSSSLVIEFPPQLQTSLQNLESMLNMNEDLQDSSTDNDGDNLRSMLQSTLLEYHKVKRLPLQEDPLMWWKSNGHKYHCLLPLVRQYLSAPASNVASEQLFSGARLIGAEYRNKLHGERAAKKLFIKNNLPSLNFEY